MKFDGLEDLMECGTERYVTVNGIDIRYAVRGSGRPLLLLHGFCEFLETWDFNLRHLGEHYQVYAMDLPGHGLSDKPYLDYSISFFTDFVVAFMGTMGIERASIVGHSFGGAISISLATSFPGKVDSLVLESSFGLGKDISLLHKLCSVPVLAESGAKGAGATGKPGVLPPRLCRPGDSRPELFLHEDARGEARHAEHHAQLGRGRRPAA
jgi:pimeloyl-ACP methyl ester carboxylesterase